MYEDNKISLSPDAIINYIDSLPEQEPEKEVKPNLFRYTTFPQCIEEAKGRPKPKQILGALFYEGEICILFADTNTGKSILAVQIGDAVTKGLGNIGPFTIEVNPQAVIICDFELTDKQVEARYSFKYQDHYSFDERFLRAEIDANSILPEEYTCFEDFLHDSLEALIVETNAKIIIIDNITYLRSETEKAKDALPLMKQLKRLKSKHGLSMLILAHTPKRDMSKPISRNDLQGSKMLINFCDSAFAIGESEQDKNLRYIKQIKERNTEKIYDADNVALFEIAKPGNFLHFSYINQATEFEHLRRMDKGDKEKRDAAAYELHKDGFSNVAIAERFGVSEGAVRKWIKKMEKAVSE